MAYEVDVDGAEVVLHPSTALTQLLGALRSTGEDAAHSASAVAAIAVPPDYDTAQRAAIRY